MPNRWRRLAGSILVIVCVAAAVLIARRYADRRGPSADIDDLRSLPYASWTSAPADRRLSGVTKFMRSRASAGYNVFTDDHDRVFLMDMNGRVIRRWTFAGVHQCEFARVFPNGDVLGVCVAQGIYKLDKKSRLLWTFKSAVNHDVDVAPDGTIAVPRIFGTTTYQGRTVSEEGLAFLDPQGRLIGQWSSWTKDGPALRKFHRPTALDRPARPGEKGVFDYYHFNAVQFLPATPLARNHPEFSPGNLLISSRNTNLVAILDRRTLNVVWSWGPGELDEQHAPVLLPGGTLLVFDNGPGRWYSRVLEIDPVTKRTIWRYPAHDDPNFFSAWRGNAQRLNNGDTLICEAEKGHAFEVTPDGTIVWEFWNPFFDKQSQRLRIYRMNRVTFDPAGFASAHPVDIGKLPPPSESAPAYPGPPTLGRLDEIKPHGNRSDRTTPPR